MIDLHLHTDASADGRHTPAELFDMAVERGVRCIAFADHNTLAALPTGRQLAARTGVEFVPAVELNTELDGRDLHLLGYWIDAEDAATRTWFTEIAELFRERALAQVDRFVELGLTLEWSRVAAASGGRAPTGSSFLDALWTYPENRNHPLVAPYAPETASGERYIDFYFRVVAPGGPAAVAAASLPVRETIARLREVGAVPVVAHPRDLPDAEFDKLVAAGLMGVEAICSYHDAAMTKRWIDVAKRSGLLHTAGSDFHGAHTKPGVRFADLVGNDYALVERLREARARVR